MGSHGSYKQDTEPGTRCIMCSMNFKWGRVIIAVMAVFLASIAGACKGDPGAAGLPGGPGTPGPVPPDPINTILTRFDDLPGVVLFIEDVSGGTGAGGQFMPGNMPVVTFTVETDDGTPIPIDQLDGFDIWFSGPTFNYQHIIPGDGTRVLSDVQSTAVLNLDGSYTYTFTQAIPAIYPPPLNDTGEFTVGEFQGLALYDGTYTIAMLGYIDYAIDGKTHRDPGNVAEDVLLGANPGPVMSREVVKLENCNECHVRLQKHGLDNLGAVTDGGFRQTGLCVTCHTSGAEDGNGASIDFRVMIHKIHNGRHLPSVVGVTTKSDGTRDYAATPAPYLVGDRDFSFVTFPVWPNFNISMPRDYGYAGLSTSTPVVVSAAGATMNGPAGQETQILRGATSCERCHGDNGYGAPLDGDLAYEEPSRRACGSCHDDVKWDDPGKTGGVSYKYISNYGPGGMPAQSNDSGCNSCHAAWDPLALPNDSIAVKNAHLHPLNYTSDVGANYFNPRININLTDAVEAGTNNGDGTIDPGEKIAITFTAKDGAGADVVLSNTNYLMNWKSAISVVLSGPTENLNNILYAALPLPALSGLTSPYTINVPEPVTYEWVGTNTGGTDSFQVTAHGAGTTPIWLAASPANPVAVTLTGTAQAGSTASTIKLCQTVGPTCPVAASSSNSTYNGSNVWITSGLGAGQVGLVTAYVGSTRVATIAPNWTTTPDATSVYAIGGSILPAVYVRTATLAQTAPLLADVPANDSYVEIDNGVFASGTAQAGCTPSCKTITLAAGASGADDFYNNYCIAITAGTGSGQTQLIADYVGATKLLTVSSNWTTVPNATSVYRIQPFCSGDDVVLDDGGGNEEYLRVSGFIAPRPGDTNANRQRIILGNRYSTSTTNATRYLRNSHVAAEAITKITLTSKVYPIDFTVVGATGTVNEVGNAFGAGTAVLVSYTTDFVMPSTYPPPFFDSPNLSSDDIETWGAWKNKGIVDGTYLLGIWSAMSGSLIRYGETNSYTEPSPLAYQELKVGAASTIVPYDKISSGDNCLSCHSTIRFHGGGRRDFDTCLMCHGTAGLQIDQKAFPSETANFRTLLHKFHSEEAVSTVFEDDGEVFPVMPGGASSCAKCHGTSTAWEEPVSRDHPTEQGAPTRVWRATCGACHETAAAGAHIDIMTSNSGAESCAVCHGPGADFDVTVVHKSR